MKFCDQPLDAFDLRWVSRRTQQLAVALNPFVYFYARLAHVLTLGYFYMHYYQPMGLVQSVMIDRDLVPPSPKGASNSFKPENKSPRCRSAHETRRRAA